MKITKNIEIQVNDQSETIRFTSFDLATKRQAYTIEQTFGLNQKNMIIEGKEITPFSADSTEQALLNFVETGDPHELFNRGLWLTENPGKDEISRNLSFYDPSTNIEYTLGGIGLVRLDKDQNKLYLEDPILDTSFHNYQTKKGNNQGGTIYFSDKGKQSKHNTTPVGVSYYAQGPYNLRDKIKKTCGMQEQGFNTPIYLAAGIITNLANQEFGFSIYKTNLTHDYLLNLGLYLDKSINFKLSYFQYLTSKYQQLSKLHLSLQQTHGQPTITNAVGVINCTDGKHSLSCVIKDLATLKPLPSQTKKTILESPCPQDIKGQVKKSPRVAAIVNDLQIALTQEFNILLIAINALPNDQIRINFLNYQYPILMSTICEAYGLLQQAEINQLIKFSFSQFMKSLSLGYKLGSCNEVLGGLSAHAMLGLSAKFRDEIEFMAS